MHLGDGVVSGKLCAVSAVITAVSAVLILKKAKNMDVPRISVMTAVFFTASLIHVKIGPASTHLTLNGLMGIILGLYSIPGVFVALLFQYLMFQHGGITTLGVNTIVMGFPALISWLLFSTLSGRDKRWNMRRISVVSFLCGGISVVISAVMAAVYLAASGSEMKIAAEAVVLVHIPLAFAEAFITMFAVSFLYRVMPSMLSD